METYIEIADDDGLVSHPEAFGGHPELEEPTRAVADEPLGLRERVVVEVSHHLERNMAIGATMLAGVGFGIRGAFALHRRHNLAHQ